MAVPSADCPVVATESYLIELMKEDMRLTRYTSIVSCFKQKYFHTCDAMHSLASSHSSTAATQLVELLKQELIACSAKWMYEIIYYL